jgi:RNA polymerase sigma-70 factor (ECF subfamily)
MSDGPPSDAEVIVRCQQGEVEPFSVLVKRYQDRVYNLAYRLLGSAEDASDVGQEAFLQAYAALSRFETGRPFAPWLYRIATNACYGLLRKRKSGTVFLDALREEEADALLDSRVVQGTGQHDPLEKLIAAVRDEEIQRAVLALPEPYRAVVLLRYHEEMSYEAIAETLEMPMGTVKTCLHRARLRLRRTLLEKAS